MCSVLYFYPYTVNKARFYTLELTLEDKPG